jgi:O-methyltransferase
MRATLKKVLPGEVVGLYRAVKNVVSPPPPPRYNQDGLATDHSSDFMTAPRFAAAYAAGKATGAWGGNDIHWRAHVACWAAARGAALEGDFVECGVDRGGLAMTVLHYADLPRLNKRFWLLDTFQGLAETHISAEERRLGVKAGGFQECYQQVKQNFAAYPFVEIIRGTVPETLPLARAERVAYLSIDMNCAGPEIAAVEYFWDKLTPGAAVLLDDYGWAGHEVQRRAFDDLARRLRVPLLAMPTGQGLILRP